MSLFRLSDKIRGLFFLIGGAIFMLLSFGVYAPFFRIISLGFSVLLIFLSLRDGTLIKAAYGLLTHKSEKYNFDGLLLLDFFMALGGLLLLLYSVGVLEELFHSILALTGIALFFYGLKESSILAKISQRIKAFEAHRKE